MKEYHSYVFDTAGKTFLGRFEEMYRAESSQGFDSWHQDDLRNLTKRICVLVLSDYNFTKVLDIGCGKGAVTQYLKKHNNAVTAVDVSETALKVARARFPDITFVRADVSQPDVSLVDLGEDFDLTVCLETLSYVENWRALIDKIAGASRYALIALFVPEHPIGFVKSFDELESAFAQRFETIEHIRLLSRKQIILFGESKRFTGI